MPGHQDAGAGIGAGAASGGRKSCPRALLPRGPQFRVLGAGPDMSVFFTTVICRLSLGSRQSRPVEAIADIWPSQTARRGR
jgi:hypothetical protein